MLDALRRQQLVHHELAREPVAVEVGHLGPDRVDAEARRLAADIDRAVVHRIAEILAGVAADHHAAALHHEAGEGAGVAADDDRAALLVDAGARADIAVADEVAAADRRAELRAGVLLDQDGAGQHVLGAGPADAALDPHVRPVDQAAAEIAERAFDEEVQPVEDADRERVLGAGIVDHDRAVALRHQLADAQVDLALEACSRVELGALVEVDVEGVRQREAGMLFV